MQGEEASVKWTACHLLGYVEFEFADGLCWDSGLALGQDVSEAAVGGKDNNIARAVDVGEVNSHRDDEMVEGSHGNDVPLLAAAAAGAHP